MQHKSFLFSFKTHAHMGVTGRIEPKSQLWLFSMVSLQKILISFFSYLYSPDELFDVRKEKNANALPNEKDNFLVMRQYLTGLRKSYSFQVVRSTQTKVKHPHFHSSSLFWTDVELKDITQINAS